MTDEMILNFIRNQTDIDFKLVLTCENFMVINFSSDGKNFIINKNKQRSNGSRIRDYTENEMLNELKKRCKAIKKYHKYK